MNKLKTFINTFFKSLISINYYEDVLKAKLSFSIKYYSILSVFLILAVPGALVAKFGSQAKHYAESAITILIEDAYPEDLEITIVDGELSINKDQPYAIPFPAEAVKEAFDAREEYLPKNFVVFDENGTIDDLDEYETLAVINKKNVLVKDDSETKGKVEAYPLSEIPNGNISKSDIRDFSKGLYKMAQWIPALMYLGFFIAGVIYMLAIRPTVTLIVAAVVLLIAKITGTKIPYSKIYQVSLHTITLPILIDLLMLCMATTIPVPMWFFLLHTLLGVLVVLSLKGAINNYGEENLQMSKDEIEKLSGARIEENAENDSNENVIKKGSQAEGSENKDEESMQGDGSVEGDVDGGVDDGDDLGDKRVGVGSDKSSSAGNGDKVDETNASSEADEDNVDNEDRKTNTESK